MGVIGDIKTNLYILSQYIVNLFSLLKFIDLRIYTFQLKLHDKVMCSYFTILSVFLIMGTFGKEYDHSNLVNPCNFEKSKVCIFKKLNLCKWVNSVTESPLLRQL